MPNTTNETDETRFTITLKRDIAWMLRAKLTLGPRFNNNPEYEENMDTVYELRGLVNDALVSLYSNYERKDYPIRINENQAWIIDQCIDFDGGGDRTKLLMQVIRGLWGLQHGIPELPVRTNRDPWGWVNNENSSYLLPTGMEGDEEVEQPSPIPPIPTLDTDE